MLQMLMSPSFTPSSYVELLTLKALVLGDGAFGVIKS